MEPDVQAADRSAATPATKDVVASLAGQVPRLSTGDRAALRRMMLTGSQQATGVVVGLLHKAGAPEAAWRGIGAFGRWKLLAHIAAVLSGTGALMPHAPGRPLGQALFEAGFSENRLMRLTSACGPALQDQVVRMARYLAQAGMVPVNLRTVHDLLDTDARAEAARLRIARDYYRADHARERSGP